MKKQLLIIATFILVFVSACSGGGDTITIGTITSTETKVNAHIYKTLIEDQTDVSVDIKEDLASSPVVIEAMQKGELQGSTQYTGTSLSSFFSIENPKDKDATLEQAKEDFAGEDFNFKWFDSLGFSNTYVFTVREEVAEEYDLEKVSDLEGVADEMRAGFDTAWLERDDDGYPAFKDTYGFEFGDTKPMEISLVYDAVKDENMDVVLAYSTDARIQAYDLVNLEDDEKFFPPYDASPVFLQETIDEHPEIGEALEQLTGLIDEEKMSELNGKVDIEGESLEDVAEEFLKEEGLIE